MIALVHDPLESPHTLLALLSKVSGEECTAMLASPHLAVNLETLHASMVVNQATGTGPYDESYVPSICSKFGYTYTGSDVLTTALCQDKFSIKSALIVNKIPTPFAELTQKESFTGTDLQFPVILKPAHRHTIEKDVVDSQEALANQLETLWEEAPEGVMIEQYIEGRALHVCLLDGEVLSILANVERRIDKADLNPNQTALVEYIAKKTYLAAGCRDWAEIDMSLGKDDGLPYVLSVNSIPKIMSEDTSTYLHALSLAGITTMNMLESVIQSVKARGQNHG
jgi:D-alanine-D-alanine ligase